MLRRSSLETWQVKKEQNWSSKTSTLDNNKANDNGWSSRCPGCSINVRKFCVPSRPCSIDPYSWEWQSRRFSRFSPKSISIYFQDFITMITIMMTMMMTKVGKSWCWFLILIFILTYNNWAGKKKKTKFPLIVAQVNASLLYWKWKSENRMFLLHYRQLENLFVFCFHLLDKKKTQEYPRNSLNIFPQDLNEIFQHCEIDYRHLRMMMKCWKESEDNLGRTRKLEVIKIERQSNISVILRLVDILGEIF